MKSSIPSSVGVAAIVLDGEIPGWYDKINLSRFDLSHPDKCVLAQSTGLDYDEAFEKLFVGDAYSDKAAIFYQDSVYNTKWRTEINERRNRAIMANKPAKRAAKVVKPKQSGLVTPSAFTVHIPQIGAASIKKEDVPALLDTLRQIIKELE